MDSNRDIVKSAPGPFAFHKSDRDAEPRPGPWEIVIAGDLTEKQTDLLESLAEVPAGSPGIIYFDSCGGSAYVGIALASLIRLRGLKADGVVLGECSSAALLPFAACPRRFVPGHASLFFHPVRWSSEEDVNLEEAAEWARHFKVLEADLDQLLARLFELPLEKLQGWTRPGRFFTGREIVAAGLALPLDLFGGNIRQQIANVSGQPKPAAP